MKKNNLIIACGERTNGNSDYIANFILKNTDSDIIFTRNLNFTKCNHCYNCEQNNICRINDDATKLFSKMRNYKNIIFVSPVIFYNFPSHTKTFIDRAQYNWSNTNKKNDTNIFLISVAGQTFNDTFYGIIKTLKVFAISLGMKYSGEELFFGIDKKGEIETPENINKLTNFINNNLK